MKRSESAIRILLCSMVIAGGAVPTHAQLPPAPSDLPTAPSGFDKLDPILQAAVATPAGRSLVIVRATDAELLDDIAALIVASGGTPGRELSIIEGLAADVPNGSILALADNAIVRRIAADRPTAGSMERTGAAVGAASARQAFGYTGAGVGIAVIDSGVTPWHDDLQDATGAQRVADFVDFVNGQPTPYDDYGHGTHVAGIIAGNGFDSGGARSGIAPDARIIALKVLDQAGSGRISDVIAAIQYVISYRQTFSIRIINLSVAAGVYESFESDFLTLAAKRAVDAGLVVVAAAGNHGRRDGRTLYGAVTSPGNAPWVLTVGAASHGGTIDRVDDTVAAFSSRGPTLFDYVAKPDIVAPGVGIESLSDPTSALYTQRPASLLDGTVAVGYLPYLSLSGTSQAAPVVSGTIALMLQANANLTPNAVKAILQYTAQIYGFGALTEGAGFLNAQGAIELARYFAGTDTSPSAGQGWSHHVIWGNQRIAGGVLEPTANAWGLGVTWGIESIGSDAISWGVTQVTTGLDSGQWLTWSLDDTAGSSSSENVVWGSACGGADCPTGTQWTTTDQNAIVFGTSEDDTIVWGTTDDDTIVWGTTCDDPSCGP